MSGALSKRQQARNEKLLQELVHNVPGNQLCADCHARNPAWASWSLGVFLCMRCAAIHRKLGTHISKVKSLSMDSWSNEQVDNMRKVGNIASNNIYNPEHRKPPIPVDVDEADSAMERFIRQKYMNNTVNGAGKPRAPIPDDETPPPLPPKNSKFGFRSASSIFPLSSKSKKDPRLTVTARTVRSPSPRMFDKPTKSFGATFDQDQPDETDQKLARLQDMGFNDTKRNALVLKGVNGNLERAIEALVRLGEGGRPSPLPTPSPREHSLRTSRSLTPLTPNSGGLGLGLGAGLSVPVRSATDRPTTPSSASTNPFDNLGPAPPQTAQSTGNLQNKNPYGANPFGVPPQQPADPFGQAFQSMSLSPVQPLFPHHTGGPAAQPLPPLPQQPAYQQPMAPSAPTSPSAYMPMAFNNMTYPQPVQPQPTGYNPFFSGQSSPVQQQPPQASQPLSVNTAQPQASYNPFARSPTRIASPSLGQIPEQSQTSHQSPSIFQNNLVFQSPAPLQHPETATNPFFANANVNQAAAQMGQQAFGQQQVTQQQVIQQQIAQPTYGQQSFGQQLFGQQPQQPQPQLQQQPQMQLQQHPQLQLQQQQQQQFYQPQRANNASIMALYNQVAPQLPTAPQSAPYTAALPPTIPENQPIQIPSAPVAPIAHTQSVPQPLSPKTNPFMNNVAPATNTAPDPFAARSRESMNLGMDLAWTNGRHSPDAFASLSARHV
ncbi:hypothetical protein EDB81DRAFT_466494 [Dactylonectria macrodidyma]|uniref:UBA domain-containing protein 3 n=1 Tax=Dactylonectria macrodidyma TaxID=307937 RepID=A0A9P9EXW8_9HYPO|nr:hypothetical protein EDB81DRAFT_466494 [Dactylonectria macrodidyma]